MSRIEENRRDKLIFKRRVCFTLTLFLFMTAGLFVVDYFFYKNIEGMESINIFNILNRGDRFKLILFGRELMDIPIK